jgi:hypothetical protein
VICKAFNLLGQSKKPRVANGNGDSNGNGNGNGASSKPRSSVKAEAVSVSHVLVISSSDRTEADCTSLSRSDALQNQQRQTPTFQKTTYPFQSRSRHLADRTERQMDAQSRKQRTRRAIIARALRKKSH